MTDLNQKKILLVMPNFFGYEKLLATKLRARGATVVFWGDRPSVGTISKVITRIDPALSKPWADPYFRKLMSREEKNSFDFILVIKGEALSRKVTEELFDYFPRARKILYLWDSFRNSKGAASKKDLFDSVLTFDRADAQQHNVQFRPLFFADTYRQKNMQSKASIDLLFVGTAHTDRYKVIKKIQRSLGPDAKVFFYFFLANKLIYWFRKLFDTRLKGASIEEFHFTALSATENAEMFRSAIAVVDVERNVQVGLTMRTLEVLAAEKKLITTNADIAAYDFYNPKNILIVDRENPVVPQGFLSADYATVPTGIMDRYSLDGWIDEVFTPTTKRL